MSSLEDKGLVPPGSVEGPVGRRSSGAATDDIDPVVLAAYRAWPDAEDVSSDPVGIIEQLAAERDAALRVLWLVSRAAERANAAADILDGTTEMMVPGSGSFLCAKSKRDGLLYVAKDLRRVLADAELNDVYPLPPGPARHSPSGPQGTEAALSVHDEQS